MNTIKEYIFTDYDIDDISKNDIFNIFIRNTLSKTFQMFKYENLPETIPELYLEKYLQCNGSCIIAEYEGYLYAFSGGFSGQLDEYYFPVKYVVNNPYLGLNKIFDIDVDCVFCRNDKTITGTLPIIKIYSQIMTEAMRSLRMQTINSRSMSIMSASDDETIRSAEEYIKSLCAGNIGFVKTDNFNPLSDSESFKVFNVSSAGNLILQNIELMQFAKGTLLNELGINAQWNNKRAQLANAEAEMNNDNLIPFVDDMLNERKIFVRKMNEMYGTTVSVELNALWQINKDKVENIFDKEVTNIHDEKDT